MRDFYKEYRKELQKVVDKCEDEFEKRLIYIAAGALGLSFTFISNIVEIDGARFIWILICGWISLIACICINLLSHTSSKTKAQKTIDEIDNELEKEEFDDTELRKNIDKRNKNTEFINKLTTWLMIGGICLIVAFASINMLKSNTEKDISQKEEKSEIKTLEISKDHE